MLLPDDYNEYNGCTLHVYYNLKTLFVGTNFNILYYIIMNFILCNDILNFF